MVDYEDDFKPIVVGGTGKSVEDLRNEIEAQIDTSENSNTDEPEELSLEEATEEYKIVIKEPKQKTQELEDEKNNDDSKPRDTDVSKKHKSRAQERIRQVISEKRTIEEERDRYRQEVEMLKQAQLQGTKQSKETLKESLEARQKALKEQYKQAYSEGDADKLLEIQEQMWKVNSDIVDTHRELARVQVEEKQQPTQPVQPKVRASEKALTWIDEHPEFKTDEVFNAASLAVNNKLIREGYDPNSDEFYAELTERLAPRFKDYFKENEEDFGVNEEDEVQLDKSSNSRGHSDVKPASTKKAVSSHQVVPGSSRSPATQIRNPNKKPGTVTFTSREVQAAERMGQDLKTLAKNIDNINRNKDENGFVPIIIKRT